MKWLLITIIALCSFGNLQAQKKNNLNKYRVQFTDKKNTPYSVFKPEEYLSPRAIERRRMYGITITSEDFPVNPSYLKALTDAGAEIYTTSRWLNSATIYAKDEAVIEKITTFDFVDSVEQTGRHYKKKYKFRKDKKRDYKDNYYKIRNEYGLGWNQISMLNGQYIHDMGFRGDGMLVAVLDGGFMNVEIMPFFDSLRANGRMLESKDFVDNDDWAYESSTHGSHVLSTMAANLPGMLVGTAPNATYVCVKTEDTRSEMRIEEDNWVSGAEYADSIGADVINTSLGYTSFSEKEMNHTYESMDGKTSRATIAADIAARKGILVVTSAGNEGGGAWKYVGAPADADSVLAVGSVNRNRFRSYFSSQGPTYDNRIKPNVMARGDKTVLGSIYSYRIDSANGTSFAAPVMAGMITSLWQAFPDKNNMDIIEAVEKSGDKCHNPDNKYGYGIPDFVKAYQLLTESDMIDLTLAFPTDIVIKGTFSIIVDGDKEDITAYRVDVKTTLGEEVMSRTKFIGKDKKQQHILIKAAEEWKKGVYIIEITNENTYESWQFKAVKS